MHRDHGKTYFSASDLADFIVCRHVISLGLINLDTPLPKKASDEETEILQQHGIEHEKNYVAKLQQQGRQLVEILATNRSHAQRLQDTVAAMQAGADVIYQAAFEHGPFRGYADFLLKVDTPSRLGAFSYEIADTKLARHGKARHLVQIALYSDMLGEVQGVQPAYAHLELGDATTKTYRLDDYRHYVAMLKQRFLAFAEQRPSTTPESCSHCGLCPWEDLCEAEWKRVDHLNQVANIRAGDIDKLRAAGVETLEKLAAATTPVASVNAFPILQVQARLQLHKRQTDEDRVEFKQPDPEAGNGFYRLPEADEGDLYFDMEGYPYEEGGLEYLFGVCYRDAGVLRFQPFWGHDRAGEKLAFEQFVDFVVERIRRYPKLHIYHYADYERRALQKLMQVHGTREAEVDQLLRDHRLVDLYAVVRHSIMTSEPRYSIKNLETFYMKGERASDVKNAGASIVYYEHWRHDGKPQWLEDIERYNEEDCVSTEKLHHWLLALRPKAEAQFGMSMPWFESAPENDDDPAPAKPRSAEALAAEARKNTVRKRLLTAVETTTDATERKVAQLLLHLLDFYWREAKPGFWKMFEQQEKTHVELMEDLDAIGALTLDASTAPVPDKQSLIYRYQMPAQEHRLQVGNTVRDTQTLQALGAIYAIDADARTIDLRIGKTTLNKAWDGQMPAVLSIAASGNVNNAPLDAAVLRFAASRYGEDPAGGYEATWRMLEQQLPAVEGLPYGAPVLENASDIAAICDVVGRMRNSHLVVQGPPGTGKTYTGARVILSLLAAGKRVGVCATSHKAVANLLNAVAKAAREKKQGFSGLRKGEPDSLDDLDFFTVTNEATDTLDPSYRLVGGTAWVFSRPDADQTYDYLFVDEAGQVSLANLVAMSCSAKNVVLLGDQMQLGQPLQGTHPGDSGLSALQYLLREHATVPPELGILLNVSRRMHPAICSFISQAVYDGRLTHYADTEKQRLVLGKTADPVLKEAGIVFDAVSHAGCAQTSLAEAERIKALVVNLLQQSYVDASGVQYAMTADKILVVAPYNAQVRLLKDVLPDSIAVGTVDKFQGQEAEVVIVSMTTSGAAEMPRNMEFLFDRHRLNVAISRAKVLTILVASPGLLEIDCRTPEQIALVDTLCWVAEIGLAAEVN